MSTESQFITNKTASSTIEEKKSTRTRAVNRRNFLQFAAVSTGALVANKAHSAAVCMTPTTEQTEGPFYPKDWTEYETDADMTKLANSSALANGQLTILTGKVINFLSCKPIANAQVDVWQANAYGQYFHESDATKEELQDQNFQYRCRIITDKDGNFSFKTIKPSPYPAGPTWVRPPHIHIKVTSEGHPTLTTQLYFSGDPLNSADRILNSMTQKERGSVVVDFQENLSKVLKGEVVLALK